MVARMIRFALVALLGVSLGACAEKRPPRPDLATRNPAACYAAIQNAKPLSACDEDCKKSILEVCLGNVADVSGARDGFGADAGAAEPPYSAGRTKPEFDIGQVPLGLNSSGGGQGMGSNEEFLDFLGEILKLAVENAHHFIH